ncbi:hypothetical protein QN277_012585 [Acacia crassicarpa]|uniref:Uncharacterized protein n=1 Tax=Acacia crassicarpa TaxID=499986 RepID=A0AAE1TER8_9FABA|nr:hypothetical protein QN277_012585 [Acacia crassicarpa]
MFRITSQLKLCGEKITDEDMLEKKTFSTFHATNLLLQQQYREKGFKKYAELISCLLVVEQNNELLLMNHESHPTGLTPFLEVNAITNENFRGRGRGRKRDYNRRGGRGRGSNRKRDYNRRGGRGRGVQIAKETTTEEVVVAVVQIAVDLILTLREEGLKRTPEGKLVEITSILKMHVIIAVAKSTELVPVVRLSILQNFIKPPLKRLQLMWKQT